MAYNNTELERIELQRLARRVLYDEWEDDLRALIIRAVSVNRMLAWVIADTAFNYFKNVHEALNVLYDTEPKVTEVGKATSEYAALLSNAKTWARMPIVQRDTRAIGDMLIRLNVDSEGNPVYRNVYPDCVQLVSDPNNPDKILKLTEDRGDGLTEVFDISDPNKPTWRWYKNKHNVTKQYVGNNYDGKYYPFRWSDGRPMIPYNFRHSAVSGKLWNHQNSRQLISATLMLGMGYSFWHHCVLHGSWPVRYIGGLIPAGAQQHANQSIVDESGNEVALPIPQVPSDPAIVNVWLRDGDWDGEPIIGQWASASSPKELMESLKLYERSLAGLAGLDPSELQRTSGDPTSGYSLEINLEQKRIQQRRQEPACRVADLELITKMAALLNGVLGTKYPENESAYQIAYPSIPKSADEQEATQGRVGFMMDKGLMSKMQAMRELYPEKTEEERIAVLAEIEFESKIQSLEPIQQEDQPPLDEANNVDLI